MGATAEDDREYLQEPKRPPRTYTKYICIAASCIALVLLAVALSFPISNLLAEKTLDGAYKSANDSDNEIDDTAPDGFRPTQDGYKRDSTRTGEQPPLSPPPPPLPPSSSTPATTTESATTTTSTTQSTTTTTVTTETTTTTTEEASTEMATRRHRRRSHREEPDTTTTVPLTNQTSTKPYRWFNRTRSPIVPGYIVYEAAMKKVSVHVVYECHCPRSRRFIVSQLLPVYELLREYMHLRLLPFGRARVDNATGGSDGGNHTASNTTTTPSSASSTEGSVATESAEDSGSTESTDGGRSSGSNSSEHNSTSSPTITCPRGNKECHSSMVQTCVLRHVEETLTAVRIIACMSRYPDPHRVGRRCVEKHGLEWHMVDQCVTEQGKLLMLDMGKKTWLITGSVNSVPLIRVGGETSHVIQVEAQTNLLELICERLNNRPEACGGRQNATRDGLPMNDTVSTGAPSVTTSQESSTAC